MIGQVIGTYRIVDKLGEGGMGVVFSAEHTLLGKRAAIKVLLPEFSSNPGIVQRFFNEARATTQIRHPNILDIYDFGTANGSAFIVMELLDGESLASRMRREGRLPEGLTIDIVRQVASALAAAHQANIVHRDLKPDNVYLVPDASVTCGLRVKVLDFGIAKLAGDGGAGLSKTRTGAVMGTPAYMSPEQCRGAGAVDGRTDIYALACMTYEMLCGATPFRGEGPGDVLAAQIYEQPTQLSRIVAISGGVDAAIMRSLAKKPEDRPQTMAAFIAELDERRPVSSPSAPFQPSPSKPSYTTLSSAAGEAARRPQNRSGIALGVVAGLVLLGAGGLTFYKLSGNKTPKTDEVAVQPNQPDEAPAKPTPEPAVPDRVDIQLASTPPGAEVFRVDGVRVGKTPFHDTRPRGDGDMVYRIHLSGYADKQIEVPLATGGIFDVTLVKGHSSKPPVAAVGKKTTTTTTTPVATPPPPVETAPKVRPLKNGVVDPFAN